MADSSLKRQAEASPPHQRQRKTTRTESGGDIEMSEQGPHDINARILASLPPIIVKDAQSPSFNFLHAVAIFHNVLGASPNLRAKKDPAEVLSELITHPEYVEIIRSCALSGNFDGMRTLPFIETVNPSPVGPSATAKNEDGGRLATIKSWGEHYTGSAPSCLFKVITEYHNFVGDPDPYSLHLSIVQSSGTGKSRMVDELSKTHLVIPVNLRKAGTNGYPPADDAARTFLLDIPTLDDPAIYYTAYLTALFEITSGVIRTIKSKLSPSSHPIEEAIAFQFRALMTEPNSSSVEACFRQHGEPRTNFYGSVVARARELVLVAQKDNDAAASSKVGQYLPKQENPRTPPSATKQLIPESPDQKYTFASTDLIPAARALVNLIKPQKDAIYDEPLIILSFDEAHSLADPSNRSEELFFTLRRVIRRLCKLPIFTLFLSTTSNIQHFAPPVKLDRSNRVLTQQLQVFRPYMELGFDQFAEKLRDGARTIQEVSQYEYMVKFGRPLFATRYKYGSQDDRDNIVSFALNKLGSSDTANKDLACMAVRLALQFNATTMEAHYKEKQQVSDHMRICLTVDKNLESMVTVAPSEPILAEAARKYMRRSGYSLPGSLLNELKTPGLNKGDRGELVALVLLTLACDSASSAKHAAAFPLLDFFKHLFPAEIYADICETMPAKERTPDERRKFRDTFRNSKIYFNHFIKVNDYKVVNRKFLLRLIWRGAAVLCNNNQLGIDIIVPFLYDDDRLHSQNVGAIFLQIKNVRKMSSPVPHIFDAINPYHLHFFDKAEKKPVPVIRMVFSLGSSNSDVVFPMPSRRQPPRAAKSNAPENATVQSKPQQSKGKGPAKAGGQATATEDVEDETASKKRLFTAFDIWCAGAYSDTFAVIKPDEEITYAQLLKASKTFPAAYESNIPEAVVLRKEMNPASAWEPEHWHQFTASEELSKELSAKKGKSKRRPAKKSKSKKRSSRVVNEENYEEDTYESDNSDESDHEDATD